jgi:hypothetical protein
MKTMTQKDLNRLGKKKGFKVKRKMGAQPKKPEPEVEVEDEVALSGAETPEAEAPAPALPLEVNLEPFAAMSASNAARDAQMGAIIENNTKVIEGFQKQLAGQVAAVPNRVPWRHTIKRTDKNLIKEVISTPIEAKA